MLSALWRNGQSCVALAALLFSTSSLFVKLTSEQLSVLEICALSSSGCAVILFLSSWLPGDPTTAVRPTASLPLRTAALVALRSCLGAVTILCYYAAVEFADIRDATALFFTSPLFTLVFECAVRRRLPGKRSILGAALTAAGALMVSHTCFCMLFSETRLCAAPTQDDVAPETGRRLLTLGSTPRSLLLHSAAGALWSSHPSAALQPTSTGLPSAAATFPLGSAATDASASTMQAAGLGLAVLAAATNALAFITIQAIGSSVSTLTLTFWHHTATATAAVCSQLGLMLWMMLWVGQGGYEGGGSGSGSAGADGSAAGDVPAPPAFVAPGLLDGSLVAGVMLTQLLAQVLLNRGFSLTTPTRGAAINVLQVVFSFVWDSVVFGNKLQVTSVAGGMLIVSGVLVQTSVGVSKRHQRQLLQQQLQQQLERQEQEQELEQEECLLPLKPREQQGPVLVLSSDGLIQPLLGHSALDLDLDLESPLESLREISSEQ